MSPNDRLDRGVLPLDQPWTAAEAVPTSAFMAPYGEAVAEVQEGEDGLQPALSGTGFTYRHNWGLRRGQWVLRLNWSVISPRSLVFVAIGEGAAGGPDAGKFIGSARYTLHNVAPRAGGVDIWVNVEWSSDIPLYVDYLIVNTTAAPPTLRTVAVTVHRHSSVALTEAEADRILADMGTILQNDDTGPDVATAVRFVRNGAVRLLPATVPGTIATSADLTALLNAGTGVKIVQAIRWCGGPGDSIIGCAPVGSPSVNVAAVRFTANQEGLIWVHEYGHNCGLGHRTDDPRAVMYPSVGVDHNVVNAAESAAFLAGPLSVTAGAAMPASGCSCGAGGMQAPSDVREFVSQHWVEGVPYELASQYTEKDARVLLEWLVNEPEKHEEFLPQIVATLGYIGSAIAAQPLIDFVRSPRSGRAVFNAKNIALIRLGDLINRSGSTLALDFLKQVAGDMGLARALATPQATAEVAAAKATPGVVAPALDTLGAELAVSATFGLALAGTAEAQKAVEALKADPDAYASVNQAAGEAAQIGAAVLAKGRRSITR